MRYESKDHFLNDVQREYQTLRALLARLNDEDHLIAGVCAHWTIKDMLAHLSEWHQLALTWYKTGSKGEKPQMPTPDFKWNQIRDLNRDIYEKNKDKSLAAVRSRFTRTHNEIMKLIAGLSKEQLLSPGYYGWTTEYPLTTYLHPNTSGHYRWAIKHIKKWQRNKKPK